MNLENLIAIEHFCTSHNIEPSFVISLKQFGLIELTSIEDKLYIGMEQLPELERFVTFHFELEINLEGIETIVHLLGKISQLQIENNDLRNRLGLQ
jgi:hypothetical protein